MPEMKFTQASSPPSNDLLASNKKYLPQLEKTPTLEQPVSQKNQTSTLTKSLLRHNSSGIEVYKQRSEFFNQTRSASVIKAERTSSIVVDKPVELWHGHYNKPKIQRTHST